MDRELLEYLLKIKNNHDYWFVTKQTLSDFYFVFLISEILYNFRKKGKNEKYPSYYTKSFSKISEFYPEYSKQTLSYETYRNTKIAQFFGLVSGDSKYNKCIATEAFTTIKSYVSTKLDLEFYSKIIERQLEKIVLNRTDLTESNSAIHLHPIIFIYKVCLELYKKTDSSIISFTELCVFIIRCKQYNDWKKCVELIILSRNYKNDKDYRNLVCEIMNTNSVKEIRFDSLFRNLSHLKYSDERKKEQRTVSLNDIKYINEIIEIYENAKIFERSYEESIKLLESSQYFKGYIDDGMEEKMDKNLILYGPPGTGKTYQTVIYAVSAIENKPYTILRNENYNDILSKYREYEDKGYIKMCTFHQSFGYEDFVEGIKPDLSADDIKYIIESGIFKEFCEIDTKGVHKVFIIDEINRANVSKVFGELITLIEPNKRLGANEEKKVVLPYSKKEFGVPSNLTIIGTMNTADRSITPLDSALRRRFEFIEILPDFNLFANVLIDNLNIEEMFDKINERIAVLYDREHAIGHAFLLELLEVPTLNKLSHIYKNRIIPLLQEYFYDDYEKIRLVLADNKKEKEEQFIQVIDINSNTIYEDGMDYDESNKQYIINADAFNNINSYEKIYK